MHPLRRQHLCADDHQHDRQSVFQVVKAVDHVGQQEVKRPQAHDGENVRRENDEGVGGDGEIAGMLSTAKTRSVASISSNTTNIGVA
ncbi:hypothetical protein D3C87_2068440 [compost metagenome]